MKPKKFANPQRRATPNGRNGGQTPRRKSPVQKSGDRTCRGRTVPKRYTGRAEGESSPNGGDETPPDKAGKPRKSGETPKVREPQKGRKNPKGSAIPKRFVKPQRHKPQKGRERPLFPSFLCPCRSKTARFGKSRRGKILSENGTPTILTLQYQVARFLPQKRYDFRKSDAVKKNVSFVKFLFTARKKKHYAWEKFR